MECVLFVSGWPSRGVLWAAAAAVGGGRNSLQHLLGAECSAGRRAQVAFAGVSAAGGAVVR